MIVCVADLSGKSHATEDGASDIPLSGPGGLFRYPPADENMFDGWHNQSPTSQGSPQARPIHPPSPISSARLPSHLSSSSNLSRHKGDLSKNYPSAPSGSGTRTAPTIHPSQHSIGARRSHSEVPAHSTVSNTKSGRIAANPSPHSITDIQEETGVRSGAESGIRGQAGGQL